MTISIEAAYDLPSPKNARVMHRGVALPFTVDAVTSTPADSETFALNNIINGLTIDQYRPNATTWTLELDLTGGAADINAVCVGMRDGFTAGQTITLQYDDGGFTTIAALTPTDNSPLLFLFSSKNTATIRLTGVGTGKPTIYNVMVGNALVMQRPFYAGFTPARMNRQTEVLGNLSGSGELMGTSIKRTVLKTTYPWRNLEEAWVRANLDAPAGLIQNVEGKSCYLAWRPIDTQDVDYAMLVSTSAPASQGERDLWSFSLSAEVHSYE